MATTNKELTMLLEMLLTMLENGQLEEVKRILKKTITSKEK